MLTTLFSAALGFLAGLLLGHTRRRPSEALPPGEALPHPPSTPESPDLARSVGRVFDLHGARSAFSADTPDEAALERDLAAFGTARYAAGRDGVLDVLMIDHAALLRAAEMDDAEAMHRAIEGQQRTLRRAFGVELDGIHGVPTWRKVEPS